MKVTYEFDYSSESQDYFDIKLFQHAQDMFAALCELDNYTRQLRKDRVNDTKEEIIDRLFDIIIDSKIGDIE